MLAFMDAMVATGSVSGELLGETRLRAVAAFCDPARSALGHFSWLVG